MNASSVAAVMTAAAIPTIREKRRKYMHGGSRFENAPEFSRGRCLAGKQLRDDSFLGENELNETKGETGQTWTEEQTERRRWLPCVVYNCDRAAVASVEPFFGEGNNKAGIPLATTDLKMYTPLWQLSYGKASDEVSRLICLSDLDMHECRHKFFTVVVECL